jgi:hypothetical protein
MAVGWLLGVPPSENCACTAGLGYFSFQLPILLCQIHDDSGVYHDGHQQYTQDYSLAESKEMRQAFVVCMFGSI